MRALPVALAILIALPLLGTLALLPLNQGLWWDEAVYLGLADGLAQGRYSLDPVFPADSFRPPLFPLFLLPFRNPLLARLAVLGTALLAIAATALLAERLRKGTNPGLLGERSSGSHAGLWAAALLATASSFVFFSSKALTEPLFIALTALSIIAVHRAASGGRVAWLFFAGLLAGLAVLARYFGLLLVLAELLLLLRWRWNPLPWLIGAALLIVPWILLTVPIYGLPFGAIGANLKVYATVANPDVPAQGLASVLGLAGLLALGGLALLAHDRISRPARAHPDAKRLAGSRRQGPARTNVQERGHRFFCAVNPAASLTALLAILAAASFLLLPNKEPRYLLSFLGAFAALGGLAAAWLTNHAGRGRALLAAGLCILLLLSALAGLSQQWQDRTAASALLEANAFLAPRTSPDEVILTTSPPYLSLVNRRGLGLCGPHPTAVDAAALAAFTQCNRDLAAGTWDPRQLAALRERFDLRWLVIYRFEPTAPLYLPSSAEHEGAVKAASFAQWGDPEAVLVYELALASGG